MKQVNIRHIRMEKGKERVHEVFPLSAFESREKESLLHVNSLIRKFM